MQERRKARNKHEVSIETEIISCSNADEAPGLRAHTALSLGKPTIHAKELALPLIPTNHAAHERPVISSSRVESPCLLWRIHLDWPTKKADRGPLNLESRVQTEAEDRRAPEVPRLSAILSVPCSVCGREGGQGDAGEVSGSPRVALVPRFELM